MREGDRMRFSERYKYKPVRDVLQIDSMDDELRNSLWSALQMNIWLHVQLSRYTGRAFFDMNDEIHTLFVRLWLHYFKLPVDNLHDDWPATISRLRQEFFGWEWYEVYDFVEFVVGNYPFQDKKSFIGICNHFLERECSAYRFVNGVIVRITDEEEVLAIENALKNAEGPVRTHLHRALELLSDRKSPDYRNSIKESISAIESLVGNVLGEKGTLGNLIKKLVEEIGVHPALGKAFSNLYGYTSDQDGIRHAIMESGTVNFEDAKFFLVVCSAFANFVSSKIPGSK